jgi:transposase
MNERKAKGYKIAQENKIQITKDGWLVESQSGNGFYKVSNEFICNCPDSELHRETCKHAFAVRYYLNIEKRGINGLETEKIPLTYPQAWSIYNEAQTSEGKLFYELLRDLVKDLEDPETKKWTGRPRLKFSESLYIVIAKVYSQLSSRRANSLFGMIQDKGFLTHIPHFNTITKVLNRKDVTPILQELIATTSAPLKSVETDFAIDSSGFRTRSFSQYAVDKYHMKKEHKWIKAHICCGVKTNIITAVKITDAYSADTSQFIPLAQETRDNGFVINEMSGDKAYSSKANLRFINNIGGTAFIPFKSNTSISAGSSRIWKRMYHYFELNKDEFLLHYHKRSNVESTFASIKRKLGDTLRSKTETAQANELLCKIIAYNITVLIQEMYELGIKLDFKTKVI